MPSFIERSRRKLFSSASKEYVLASSQTHQKAVTVILPEKARSGAFRRLFAHPEMLLLKIMLFVQPDIIVTNVAWEAPERALASCPGGIHHHVLVPIAELDWASLRSLTYARSISPHITAVHVATDLHDVEVIRTQWEHIQKQVTDEEQTHLVVIESPYRSLLHPLLAYIDTVRELYLETTLTVILPEFVVDHWWEHLLHNQTALHMKVALLARPGIVVTDIPQHLRKE
jgi:hypothetical protein